MSPETPVLKLSSKMFKLLLFFVSFKLLNSASITEHKTYKNYIVYELTGNRKGIDKINDYMSSVDDSLPTIYLRTGDKLFIIVPPEIKNNVLEKIKQENLTEKVVYEDYSKIVELEKSSDSRRNFGFSWTAYYDIDDINNFLKNTSSSYPEWTEIIVGGQSYEGRQILGLRINTPAQRDATDAGKPVMLIESGIHAREWITPATTTYFINQLLTTTNEQLVELRDQFDWRIFPSVNPDGYQYSYKFDRLWRKTRSRSANGCYGADPNRNWDYNWMKHGASNNPCDYQTYGGSKPFSEVETRTLSEYISNITYLLGYVGFHSDAQMLLAPYSDSVEHYDNYDDLVQIGNRSLEYGQKVNGERYEGPATAAELLYKASGGSMDWVRKAMGTPLVFTYELRGYYFHWPPSRIYEQGDEVTQMMLGLATEAKALGYF